MVHDLRANFTSSSLSTKMAVRSECFGVLRQLIRVLSQSDDSHETEFVCFRRKCEEKVFEEKINVKTPSSNEELSVCVCEFSKMQISKSQKLHSAQRCPVRYVLKRYAYINIYISNTFYVNVNNVHKWQTIRMKISLYISHG